MIKIIFVLVFFAIIFPAALYAQSMSSQNYSVEAGRVGSGVISIPGATSTSYETEMLMGEQSTYTAPTPTPAQAPTPTPAAGGAVEARPPIPPHQESVNIPLTLLPEQSGTLTQTLSEGKSIKLEAPKASVSAKTTFIISEEVLSIIEAPQPALRAELTGDNIFRVTAKDSAGNLVHTFPKKIKFTLTIPDLPEDTTDIGLYYLDTDQRLWLLMPEAVFEDDVVTFSVDHLTDFAIFYVLGRPPTLSVAFLIIGDINKDNRVDIIDFNTLMVHWGETIADNIADINNDNIVNIFDFNLLIINWSI